MASELFEYDRIACRSAKLMLMTQEELREIRPDLPLADEFHRIGASEWGAGFERLVAAYPGIPLLELSLTRIRHLDNQRDMAEELFDDYIASEMTLGEAAALSVLSDRRTTDRAGKYIVFCAKLGHLRKIQKYSGPPPGGKEAERAGIWSKERWTS